MTDTHDAQSAPPLRVLLIGSLPPPLGGTTVSLKILLDELRTNPRVNVQVVDTSSSRLVRGPRSLLCTMRVVRDIIRRCRHCDVMTLHVSTSPIPYFGAFLLLLSRMARVPLVIRKFGGNDYRTLPPIKLQLARFVLRHADLYLAQTQKLVCGAQADGITRTRWYPTSRPMPDSLAHTEPHPGSCSRYVFVGQIRYSKGIREVVEAAERFTGGVSVDVYGPLGFDVPASTFSSLRRVRYCGVVQPSEVPEVLSRYDALLLPTYHSGEGYPGVVLEAYGAGLPIICTQWMALPEIVDSSTGILVAPRSADALYEAMKRLSQENHLYTELREGVLRRRRQFSSSLWASRFVDYCWAVTGRTNAERGDDTSNPGGESAGADPQRVVPGT